MGSCTAICFPMWQRENAERERRGNLLQNTSRCGWKTDGKEQQPSHSNIGSVGLRFSPGGCEEHAITERGPVPPSYLTIDWSPIEWGMKFSFKVRVRALRTDHQNGEASDSTLTLLHCLCVRHNPMDWPSPGIAPCDRTNASLYGVWATLNGIRRMLGRTVEPR